MNEIVMVELSFPQERQRLYNRLLTLFSKYGEEALKDCSATCATHNKNVVTCWNLFNAATAAYNLGEVKKANFIWDYIDRQLDTIYKDEDFDGSTYDIRAYIFAMPRNGNVFDYLTSSNGVGYNIKGTSKELNIETPESRICVVTKMPDIAILDFSIESPVTREQIIINEEPWYYYHTENVYNEGKHRIKFIVKHYE